MEKMKISIITVCYNSRATLATAIESVLGQTYPDIEYIVVDGGSKDGTVELLRKYAEGKCANARIRECANENADACSDQQIRQSGDKEIRNKRIRFAKFLWISEPDEGMYDAINKGIRMATGDVIGILNADDFFEDDRVVERIANTFLTAKNTESTKIDVVYGDVRFVRECANKHAPRTSVYTMSERSFEASGAGARSGIPRWSGNARMRECANESVDGCTDQKTRQSGTKDSLERSGNHSANAESEAVIRQFSNELASLRNAKTIRYYSAKHWKPWMLQWGYMPPHPGVYIRRECFEKWGDYKLGVSHCGGL
jgi:glycosyltransferase involved in cell wall biosynthesis